MRLAHVSWMALCLLGAVSSGAGSVAAEESAPLPPADAWKPEPDVALAERSGGIGITQSVAAADLDSEVAGNRVGDGTTTGRVSVSDSAVSNVRGIFVGTFNTGNNTSIQSNVNVIVHLE